MSQNFPVHGYISRRAWLLFMKKVTIQTTGHWLWIGAKDKDGYGVVKWKKRTMRAHHFCFIALRGNIPDKMVPDHLCRIPACVNAYCLELVTHRVNTLRGNGPTAINAQKKTCPKGHMLEGENLIKRTHQCVTGEISHWRRCRTCENTRRRKISKGDHDGDDNHR